MIIHNKTTHNYIEVRSHMHLYIHARFHDQMLGYTYIHGDAYIYVYKIMYVAMYSEIPHTYM